MYHYRENLLGLNVREPTVPAHKKQPRQYTGRLAALRRLTKVLAIDSLNGATPTKEDEEAQRLLRLIVTAPGHLLANSKSRQRACRGGSVLP